MTAEVVKLSTPDEVSSESRPWTSLEVRTLTGLRELGAAQIAEELGRSVLSVKLKAHRLGISLRQPGSRVGRLLGQPNRASWADDRTRAEYLTARRHLVDDLVDGLVTVADLDRALTAIDAGVDLCPSCAEHVADHTDGICTACHRRRLADAHRAALAAHEAQQQVWAERQNLSRARRRTNRSRSKEN